MYQRDLLVGEIAHFLSINRERTDDFVFLQHGNNQHGSHAALFDCGYDLWGRFFEIAFIFPKIGDLNHALGFRCAADAGFAPRFERRRVLACFFQSWRQIMGCKQAQVLAVPAVNNSKLRARNTNRVLQHVGEHRL